MVRMQEIMKVVEGGGGHGRTELRRRRQAGGKRESLAAESKFRTTNKSIASLLDSQVQIQLGHLLVEISKAP